MKQNDPRQPEHNSTNRKRQLRLAVAGLTLLAGGCIAPLHESQPHAKTAETPVYGTTAARMAREPRISQLPRSIHDKIAQPAAEPVKPSVNQADYTEPITGAEVVRGASESIAPGEPMTIDQLMNFTLDHHPRLKARAAEVDVARGKLIGAGLLINPEVVLQSASPTSGDTGDSTINSRLMFTLQPAHKRQKRQEVARVGIQRASYALGVETQTVLLDAAAAALEVQYLQELVEVQQHIADLAKNAAEVQQTKEVAGVVTEVQSLISQVDAADVQFDRLKTQSQLEAARLRLSRAIGMLPPQPIAVSGKMAVEPTGRASLDDLLSVAYEIRPELGRARTAVAQSESQLVLDRAKAIPDIKLGPRFGDNLAGAGDNIGARFQFDVPLFDRNQGDIAATCAQIQVNLALLRDAELSTLSDVAAAYQQLAPLEEGLDYYGDKILPLAEKTEEAIQSVQQVELIDPYLLTTQLRRLASMRINEVSMRYAHNQIRMKLELYLGRKLDELASVQPAAQPQVEPVPANEVPQPLPAPRKAQGRNHPNPPAKPKPKPSPTAPRGNAGRGNPPGRVTEPVERDTKLDDTLPDEPQGMPADEPIEPPSDDPTPLPGDEEPSADPFGDDVPAMIE